MQKTEKFDGAAPVRDPSFRDGLLKVWEVRLAQIVGSLSFVPKRGRTKLRPMTNNSTQARRVLLIAYPDCQILDLAGPVEALEKANQAVGTPLYGIRIVGRRKGPLQTSGALTLQISQDFRGLSEKDLIGLDTLILPGGAGVRQACKDPDLLAFILTAAKNARRIASVCTGAFLLAEAGLLVGRQVTTHWDAAEEFAARYPDINLEADAIYVQDGRFWSSAGVTAGIDLTLALIESDYGHEIALSAARRLVVYMMRPGGQNQFSAQLRIRTPKDQRLKELPVWIGENLAEDLSISRLASKVAMSRRNFTRRFTEQTGVSPAAFVERCRLEHARRRLEGNDASLDRIAAESGLASAEVLRRLFQRHLGTSPLHYRARFQTAMRLPEKETRT